MLDLMRLLNYNNLMSTTHNNVYRLTDALSKQLEVLVSDISQSTQDSMNRTDSLFKISWNYNQRGCYIVVVYDSKNIPLRISEILKFQVCIESSKGDHNLISTTKDGGIWKHERWSSNGHLIKGDPNEGTYISTPIQIGEGLRPEERENYYIEEKLLNKYFADKQQILKEDLKKKESKDFWEAAFTICGIAIVACYGIFVGFEHLQKWKQEEKIQEQNRIAPCVSVCASVGHTMQSYQDLQCICNQSELIMKIHHNNTDS